MNKSLSKECLLTTKDNPFNPFTHFREWYLYDVKAGYNTCGLIARMNPYYDEDLSPGETERELESVYDRIIKNVDFQRIYKKVYKENTS